jgi:RNA:NAD 2'-phosphotransferase (TPT1/KptA family)
VTNVTINYRSKDPAEWRRGKETIGYALSQTLRHHAYQMGLQSLVVNGRETSWFRISDILSHPRFTAWEWTEEQLHQEVATNYKRRFVLHGDQLHISAWNGITMKDNTGRTLLGPSSHLSADDVPEVLTHGTVVD